MRSSTDDKTNSDTGVIFVMPRSSSAWDGAEALWITVAGWASAAEFAYGNSWVVTSDRISTADQAANFPVVVNKKQGGSKRRSWIPLVVKIFLKDLLLWKKRNRKSYPTNPWGDKKILFVWEQHDLFSGPGRQIASRLKVPLVIYVHAPVVWESAKWGVRRPLWGKLLEIYFEKRSLRRADLVACVSEEVAKKLRQLGIADSKIMVSPMSVDPRRFSITKPLADVRKKLGIEGKFVIGWTGSFRGFHGLNKVVEVFSKIVKEHEDIVLLLVGDGSERKVIEELVSKLGIVNSVRFTGKVPFADIPTFVNLFDVAIVSAGKAEDFHYSPLKLREYLVARRPTLAPRAGEIPTIFEDGKDVLMYTVGDEHDLKEKMQRLCFDKKLMSKLGEGGYNKIIKQGTWDYELEKTLKKLGI
jgi:glycosyltransferase involved in cell wall biosynthesis